jgi:hypothetical protein
MLLINFPYSYSEEETIVYIEKYDAETNIVLIDFFDSNQFSLFNLFINLNYNWQEKPTMIEIRNYKLKKLREGSYYRINRITWLQIFELGLLTFREDSLLIGFTIELTDKVQEMFLKTKTFTEAERFFSRLDQTTSFIINESSIPKSISLEVIIKNVGQGSWNEVLSDGNVEIVFDCGVLYTTSKIDVKALALSRDSVYQKDAPILILSHWDVDHYHLLLAFSDKAISQFKLIIHRGIIPTLTARKVKTRFDTLNTNVKISLAPEAKNKRKKVGYLTGYTFSKDSTIILFNGSVTTSRNKSGIGLLIRKPQTSIILSADYYYHQVSRYILPLLNYSHNHYLIIPHHGGKAGNFVYNTGKLTVLKDAIASVGKNPYGHPDKINMNNLNLVGFNTVRTDVLKSDYVLKLN